MYIQALPTWLAWNNANFTSPTGITDVNTGQPIAAGGLNAGDYFDCDNATAASQSYLTNGLLFAGRYRFVLVDSGATAGNVKTGTVGYLRAGLTMKSVVIVTAGSGQTAGTYTVNANAGSGGGSGAVISVVVGAGGTVTSVSVVSGGFNYSSVPTFTLVTGGTVGTVAAQLGSSPNLVTSFDQIAVTGVGAVRPVVFLNPITPGNYGFVQELGIATVLAQTSALTSATAAAWVDATTLGVVNTRANTNSPVGLTIGSAIDLPVAAATFKVLLTGPVVQD